MEAVRIALLETRREVSALRLLCQVPSNMNFSHSHRRLLCSIACLADFSRRNKYMIPYSRSCGKGLVRQKERLRLRDKKCVHFRTKMRALLDESARTFSRVSEGAMRGRSRARAPHASPQAAASRRAVQRGGPQAGQGGPWQHLPSHAGPCAKATAANAAPQIATIDFFMFLFPFFGSVP